MKTDKAAVQAARHRAVDVPLLRDRLLEAWRGGLLRELLTITETATHFPVKYRDEAAGVNRCWNVMEWEAWLIERLAEAELFYVTEDMTEIVEQASLAAPNYQVFRDQLPAEVGFVVYGKPFCHVPPERLAPDQRVELTAAIWAPVPDVGGVDAPQPGVMVVTLQDSDVLVWTQPTDEFGHVTPAQLEQAFRALRSQYGAVAYHEEYPLPYGDAPWGDERAPVQNAAVAAVFTTWILMTQKIAMVQREPMPRHVRKQARRAGRPEPRVRTVELRRTLRAPAEEQEQQPGGDPRKYTKRWVVQGYGYWRNTWYPSRERHELQYVHVPTYVKGPDGAPLVGGERVNVLRR